ncbi:MAG: hypothetical protein J1F40_07310 [Prevotellaceae bacterium]|nr:hypothetical protein [Prevotellaceae bacterium]
MNTPKILCSLALATAMTVSAQNSSPYISRVFEYRPAPGQYVNVLPKYEEGDTPEIMAAKAEAQLAGNRQEMISLGAYGGYITFGFDHMVKNVHGKMDFQILGNALYSNTATNPDDSRESGSCEPGIVLVSYDSNANGEPDDEWYELAGSEYNSMETTHHYSIIYYRPDENKEPTPENAFITDATYVRWTDNLDRQGYICRNSFHQQSYYPLWIEEDEMTFEGTLLANNYVDESGNGSFYVQYAYAWGYADNHPNSDDRSKFSIDWAVDDDGNHVRLPGIHFVRVYTGVNQSCGWIGETSTEVLGANDLHMLGDDVDDCWTTDIHVPSAMQSGADCYYTLGGVPVATPTCPGIYLRRKAGTIKKVLYF